MLVVPFPRRRRVEMMLRGAHIAAEWIEVPSPEAIRTAGRARLLETLAAPVELDDEDRELGLALMAERSPEDIAAMLVRAHRAKLPAPEEMVARGEAPARAEGPRPGLRGHRLVQDERRPPPQCRCALAAALALHGAAT